MHIVEEKHNPVGFFFVFSLSQNDNSTGSRKVGL